MSMMNPATDLSFFYSRVACLKALRGGRYGQALFNHLLEIRPDLAERIRGTNLDPYYCDRWSPRVHACHAWLEAHWGTTDTEDTEGGDGVL